MRHNGENFVGRVLLDGNEYVGCKFTGATLVFSAIEFVTLVGNEFDGCSWEFSGAAALTTRFMSGVFNGMGEEGRVLIESTFDDIRMARVGAEEPVRDQVEPPAPARSPDVVARVVALERELVAPDVGQADAVPATREVHVQVINNHFSGPTSQIAIGSKNFTQTVQAPTTAGDESGLLRYLFAAGVDPDRVMELREAIAADRAEVAAIGERPSDAQAWPRVRTWLGAVSTGAMGGLIVEAVKPFLGG